MSSAASANHNKRLAETENSQRHLDNDSRQQMKLRDRQRFFEEVYQHDVDNHLPSSHLHIDCRKPPMGSISSMEVNVDVLEQMDLMDISDQEALDVFLNSGSGPEEAPLTPTLPEAEDEEEEDEEAEVVYREGGPLKRPDEPKGRSKVRILSTSSGSSDTSGADADTPVIQSDDEEVHADTLLLTSAPQNRDEEESEEEEEQRRAPV
ncbi:dysbindin-like isoform X2 [Periophthalmus magnuspinnatus]|uniref:dysbindin-like isoform X2 n=1 Tax=Periophthalmus magnuspinnatus TaxID=409849 RepID=UPI002437097C|nr:dysbindin-like isoform X2 [Periophthalmus magnuspinnatus]